MKQDIFDRIMGAPGLRHFYGIYAKHKRILLYVLFGGVTTVISVSSFVLLDSVLGVNELLANICSWILAVGVAYATNRTWVFCSQARGSAMWKELLAFYSGRLITLAVEEGLLLVFVTWLAWNSTLVKSIAQVIILIGNYLISKFLIFRKAAADDKDV